VEDSSSSRQLKRANSRLERRKDSLESREPFVPIPARRVRFQGSSTHPIEKPKDIENIAVDDDQPLFVLDWSAPRQPTRTSSRLEDRLESTEPFVPIADRRVRSQDSSTHTIEKSKDTENTLVDNDGSMGRKDVKGKSVETRITESDEIGLDVHADVLMRDVEMTEIEPEEVEISDVPRSDVLLPYRVRKGYSIEMGKGNEENDEGPSEIVEPLSSGTDEPSLNDRQRGVRVPGESHSGRVTRMSIATNITHRHHVATIQTEEVNRGLQKPRTSDRTSLRFSSNGSSVAVSPDVTAALKRKLQSVVNAQPSINLCRNSNRLGVTFADKYFPKDEITRDIQIQFSLWQAGKLSSSLPRFECYELHKAWNNSFEFEIRYNLDGYNYRIQMAFLGLEFERQLRYPTLMKVIFNRPIELG